MYQMSKEKKYEEKLFDERIERKKMEKEKNHSTQDSRVVPHRGTNWAAPWLTSQIGRDAVLSRSYGRGYLGCIGPTLMQSSLAKFQSKKYSKVFSNCSD